MPGIAGLIQAIYDARKYLLLAAGATVLATSLLLYAGSPSDTIYGNYTGAGKCPPGTAKSCTDTGAMDNVFIQEFKGPETERQKQAREFHGISRTDSRVAIRILHDYGQKCTLEGEMSWSGNHLTFKDKPQSGHRICELQVWFENGMMTIKDSGDICGEEFCAVDKPTRLAGRRFKKGPDALLVAHQNSATPPPAAIFGAYHGTGRCATDERKTEYCAARNKSTDFVVIEPGGAATTRVVIGRHASAEDDANFCVLDADARWLGDHLAFFRELPDSPGTPQLLQFWFKDDSVVVRDVWNNVCGAFIQGGYYTKAPAQPNHSH